MEQQKDDKKPAVPTLKDSARPQLKIKGLQSGQSLVERLKQFKKKDLAFILSGLGVLFMAPLAEHFLMSPDTGGDGAFQQGWGVRPGQGGLGQGGSPFEGGLNGLAPGGVAGGGSDVITPLNVRDPSALIMGPGATSQAPATGAPAATPTTPASSASTDKGDWKDALAQSAAHAAHAAASKAALPVPKVPLSNGGLRGLGAIGGSGGANFSGLSAPGAAAGSSRPNVGDSLGNARGSRDFRGAAPRGSTNANAGSFEQLKHNAGLGDLNRDGSAITNLENAAARNMGSGQDGSGGSGPGNGGDVKGPSGSQNKDGKQMGDSLEFLRLKQEQEKAIDLKWKMIEKQKMFPIELKQKMIETMVMEPIKALAGMPGKMLGDLGLPGSGDKWVCEQPTHAEWSRGSISSCKPDDKGNVAKPCQDSDGGIISAGGTKFTNCSIKAGSADGSGATAAPIKSDTGAPGMGKTRGDGSGDAFSQAAGNDSNSSAFDALNSACAEMKQTDGAHTTNSDDGAQAKIELVQKSDQLAALIGHVHPRALSNCTQSVVSPDNTDAFSSVIVAGKSLKGAFDGSASALGSYKTNLDTVDNALKADVQGAATDLKAKPTTDDEVKSTVQDFNAKIGAFVKDAGSDQAGSVDTGIKSLENNWKAQNGQSDAVLAKNNPLGLAQDALDRADQHIQAAAGLDSVSLTKTTSNQADQKLLKPWSDAFDSARQAGIARRGDLDAKSKALRGLLTPEGTAAGVVNRAEQAGYSIKQWETANQLDPQTFGMPKSKTDADAAAPTNSVPQVPNSQPVKDFGAVTAIAEFQGKAQAAQPFIDDVAAASSADDKKSFSKMVLGLQKEAQDQSAAAARNTPGGAANGAGAATTASAGANQQ